MKWMILIAVSFVVGCSGEVGGENIEKSQQTLALPSRSFSAPLDGTYKVYSYSDNAGVWDVEWASMDPGARVFNRAPVPFAKNELFYFKWLFSDTQGGDVFRIWSINSGKCITPWPDASGVKYIITQQECDTSPDHYLDQWRLIPVCTFPNGNRGACGPVVYRFYSPPYGVLIDLAAGADINTWLPLEQDTNNNFTSWNLVSE
jgi:hypothetical protein